MNLLQTFIINIYSILFLLYIHLAQFPFNIYLINICINARISVFRIPKIEKLIHNSDIKGFFIAEGDLYLNDDFDFNAFLNLKLKRPTWIGYKKKLSNYSW